MKKTIHLILMMLFFSSLASAQTYLGLSDNMEPASGADIKIIQGDYQVDDVNENGIIRIINKDNITIDGDSVTVSGSDFKGYLVYIENSTRITIRNFNRVNNFYYVIRAKNSSGLIINDNDFSYNKKDTVGWISVWTGVEEALGGGVLLDRCSDSDIYGNLMTQQNDGVAMYECDSIRIHDNTLNWNCGFGIRMNYTNNCYIDHNDCSHVNRQTDPSDCAAILLIVSNNNTVEYNDLTYSGDGVFLGQYEHSGVPNNNYFAYNDCSFSPHNAIEATFADGNIYKYNKCNYSHYGFWLGYSFNSLVEGNEIIGNLQTGVAVDRGFENTFRDNVIKENPYGFDLWEGGVIDPYGDQYSHDYYLYDNTIEGNIWGVHASNTKHLVMKNNTLQYNKQDLFIEGEAVNDTISDNTLKNPTEWFIHSTSPDEVQAAGNRYLPNDEFLIRTKLAGNLVWQPVATDGPRHTVMNAPPCDMAEPDAIWQIYADPGYGHRAVETLEWDYEVKKVGRAAVKMVTPRGWDVAINYRPPGDSVALWSLSESDTLFLWIRTIKNPPFGFQACHIRVGCYNHGYYKYAVSESVFTNAHKHWSRLAIPLRGSRTFHRTEEGFMDLNQVSYVEIHADTWGFGYTLWVDGVQFSDCNPLAGREDITLENNLHLRMFPNPVSREAQISYTLNRPRHIKLQLISLQGGVIQSLANEYQPAGKQTVTFNRQGLAAGLYVIQLSDSQTITRDKILIVND